MLDLVKLTLQAGDGGHGRVSFRREKFAPKGGPDGGDGGDGGSIIFIADSHMSTFRHFEGKKRIEAEPGVLGGQEKMTGGKGSDVIVKVPLGTVIWLLAENETSFRQRHLPDMPTRHIRYYQDKGPIHLAQELPDNSLRGLTEWLSEWRSISPEESEILANAKVDQEVIEKIIHFESLKGLTFSQLPKYQLAELLEDGQKVVVAKGGEGGRGNVAFKGSTMTTPREAEVGTFGEQKVVALELKLLADIGLVGLPNAGKSTLLSVLSNARPKIAAYPFTTLEPQLGVAQLGDKEVVVADIPGLIEGAGEGKGLGHDFLRHVEHCQVIVWILTPEENQMGEPEALWHQYELLRNEMRQFSPELLDRKQLVCLSKSDLYSAEYIDAVRAYFAERHVTLMTFSSANHHGLTEVKQKMAEMLTKSS